MIDPKKKRYYYEMLAGFGAISLSIILFFILYSARGIMDSLNRLTDILAPFIYGGVVAYLLRPMCNTFEDFFSEHLPKKLKHFATSISILLSIMALILAVYLLINMIVPQVTESIVTLWNTVPYRVQEFIEWAEFRYGEDEQMIQLFNTIYNTGYKDLTEWARNTLLPQVTNIVTGVGNGAYRIFRVLYNILIGFIVAVYLLNSRKRFARQGVLIVRAALPEKWAGLFLREIAFVDRMFGGFIDAKILDSAIVGVLCYIGCSILRIPNALLVSVFVGTTNVIPFFGPFIGAVPCTLLILMEEPIKAVWFVIFVLILQQFDGNLIGPRIMGNRTGLSGFWVLFAIILFGGMWGLVGMVVCVPVFAVFYDLVKKLVKRGLMKKDKMELWEQYIADYPNNDLPK